MFKTKSFSSLVGSTIPFIILLLLAFLVRLYGISNPVADWHSWRQADTSSVSRIFITSGFDVLHPRFHDLSRIPSGKDNPNGYRFVEFPLYNVVQAGLFNYTHTFTLEIWGRLVSITASLISTLFLYFIVKKYTDGTVAFFSAFFYAFIPFNIFYSRTILPDISMVMATLGGIYFFDAWISQKKHQRINIYFFLAVLFIAVAILLKPFAVFFLLPIVYLAWFHYRFDFIKKWQLWIFVVLAVAPFILWRIWMLQYPEGIPASAWLFNGNNIRFKPSFFYWIVVQRLGNLILGYVGIGFLLIGIFVNLSSEKLFHFTKGQTGLFYSFLLSTILYIIIVATGNVQHDYYQIPIIPALALFFGLACKFILSTPRTVITQKIGWILLVIGITIMIGFRWYVIRDFYNINNKAMIEAGNVADSLLPKDAKVIAPLDGDTSFLYQTKRSGWPVIDRPIEDLIDLGAEYLVIASPTENDVKGFGKQHDIVASSSSYLILDLKK